MKGFKKTSVFSLFRGVILLAGILLVFLCLKENPVSQANSYPAYKPTDAERATWNKLIAKGIDKLVFVKRKTYDGAHYYTEFIQSHWKPGGNLYVLSLRDGSMVELAPSLTGGVFGAFDVSFDAKRVVFAYKAAHEVGYRIYEVNVDGSNLHQLTFSPDNEKELVTTYQLEGYHHATDDMDPCYLPDGGIAFISTRCHFGILCDAPDLLTTTVLYRMDADGSNMRQLTNSSVSENTPTVMPDGRILYTRWEYVDKGAISVKCLWAMNPDGSGSVEIYGNDIAEPPTMIMARNIPGTTNEFVFTGTPHCCPTNCLGTIIRVDITKDVRSRSAMTYMTPYTDVRFEHGMAFRDPMDTTRWFHDSEGRGPMFRESYPLSRNEFLVSDKPWGPTWATANAYRLSLLHEGGKLEPLLSDPNISCFRPVPLVERPTPPVISSRTNKDLADKGLAECIVTDVYRGMVGVKPGSIKYLRVMEQVPRPWGARRHYKPNYQQDEYDQQHVVISKDTHLGLKVQRGVVTVENDGSARFLVPAMRNIFLQALDANYRAIQTERTYVNYVPGEVRSCIGCHEPMSQTPPVGRRQTPIAMTRAAETPYPQVGQTNANRTLSYARDVQPVWNKNCVGCHNGDRPAGGLSLSGKETRLFNESYENLVPERRKIGWGNTVDLSVAQIEASGTEFWVDRKGNYVTNPPIADPKHTTEGRGYYIESNGFTYTKQFDRNLLGPVIGENHPKNGNVHYLPAKSLGSYSSVLVAMFCPDIKLDDPKQQQRANHLAEVHKNIKLSPTDLLQITNWVDTNCQYYGTYYGRRDTLFRKHPDYRTEYDFATALSPDPPKPYY